MDIHAPEKPIHTFKDFATHIAIVTVGILIALALEGVREHFHDAHLMRETREAFRDEMQTSLTNMDDELPRVQQGYRKLQALDASMPQLAQQHPEQVLAQLKAIQNPYYFFSTNSWQAALSTGALAHMSPAEVSMYAWSAEGTRVYIQLQQRAQTSESRAVTFWSAHPHPTGDQLAEGLERIQQFEYDQHSLAFVAPQTHSGFENTLRTANTN